MAIKYIETKSYYQVSYSKRHPLTNKSMNIRRVGFKSRGEAEKAYLQIKKELVKKMFESRCPFWKEVVREFLCSFTISGMSKNTVLNYRSNLEAHTLEIWKNKRISEIVESDIFYLIQEKMEKYSDAHKKNMLKHIRAVFKHGIKKGYIHRDPTPKITFKKKEKIKNVLNEAEMKKFLSIAKLQKHPWFPIWALACTTGMRNGELYALRWRNVDLDRRILKVSEAWTRQDGFKETKSGDDRIVEIAHNILPLMLELKRNKSNDFVLPRLKYWSTSGQSMILKKFLLDNGFNVIRFHDLRASWATLMLSKGVEPIKIMAMGGWKDLKTMQIYIRKSGIYINGITDSINILD